MNPILNRVRVLGALLLLAAAALLPAARALEPPSGAALLTITGKVGSANAGQSAVFDWAMLRALPQYSFSTATPWHKGIVKFTGPRLADLLKAAGASGSTLSASALNDYKVNIPAEDAAQHQVLVAILIDDQPIPVRDKGPLFVIYPFDSDSALRNSIYFNRSIWQLRAIEVN